MRFIDEDFHQIHREKLVDLDEIVAQLLFSLHRPARFLGCRNDDIAANTSGARIIGFRAPAADSATGGSDPRPANLAELSATLLREAPGTVLKDLDGDTGRDAQMQVELAVEILEMTVSIDKAGQNSFALNVDHFGIGRNG
jgi:hypothetical protein